VTPAQADWARCSPFIEAALAYADGAYAIEDVAAAVEAGEMGLLAGERSALVFEVAPFPRLRALNVVFAGGDLDEIRAMDPALVAIARGHGCSRIYLTGRLGWLRALKDLGYGAVAAMASKEIGHV
jgi:hypothetical protein